MECGTKTSKVHIEEGVEREKSREIFSAWPQQVVRSAMQPSSLIFSADWWGLFWRNLVRMLLIIIIIIKKTIIGKFHENLISVHFCFFCLKLKIDSERWPSLIKTDADQLICHCSHPARGELFCLQTSLPFTKCEKCGNSMWEMWKFHQNCPPAVCVCVRTQKPLNGSAHHPDNIAFII